MIRKTLTALLSSICVILVAVGCSSSKTEQEKALSSSIETSSAVTLGTQENVNTTTLAKEESQEYNPAHQYGSLWNSELFNEQRFLLNIKLSNKEFKEAKVLARSFESHMERSKVFMHYLLTELKERNLPVELVAVPLVESGFNPRARSHAGAHGPWQFTRQTGKSYGLEVNAHYDEFYDFIASTEASLKYLEHLYKELDNDWELALVAYNQGEFGVKKAIRRAKASGVKDINAKTVKFTKGGNTYLRRFREYADILRFPEKYGLTRPEIENRAAFKRVQIAGRVSSMKEAAKLSGVDLATLKHLNAGYLTDSLKSNKQHGLLIPVENATRLERAIGIEPAAKLVEARLSQLDLASSSKQVLN